MGNIMVRMGIVIGVLLATQFGFAFVGRMTHPAIVDPQKSLEDFPLVVHTDSGTWEGKAEELDKRTFTNAEVFKAVSRSYSKDGHAVKFFLAQYKEPSKGLYHNPMNCYHANGYTLVDEMRMRLTGSNRPETKISVATWTRSNEKIVVAYWYEVGDRTMYERQDLLPTQWAMMGKSQWPAMFKVLLEMPAESEQTQQDILDIAKAVREWLGRDDVRPLAD